MDDSQSKDQIFLCYRREDSAWVTGRIYDRLVQRFGAEAIFKDIDSIPLGTNFKQYIDSIIRQCTVCVVVIGDKWMDQGRINDPRDHVRIEIESALLRDIPVIPLLVQNASMPAEEALPEGLRELRYRNGIPINNDPHFHVDMNRLIKSLEAFLIPKPRPRPEPRPRARGWLSSILLQKKISLLIISIIIIVLGVLIANYFTRDNERYPDPNASVVAGTPIQTPPPATPSPTQNPSPTPDASVVAGSPMQTPTPATPSPTQNPSPTPRSVPKRNSNSAGVQSKGSTTSTRNEQPVPKATEESGTKAVSPLEKCVAYEASMCHGNCALSSFSNNVLKECIEKCKNALSLKKYRASCRR